ncbi:type II toxin-antitoxin system HicB family antitoxin [Limosilactobacillus sp.]|jgi:predicted RNase H-like HicB family nuclease|uniref:type II toxin-antitoxin system HicB family antitoxin n=1 Tax=Limosilactobacillus sp. TaxID=2773925 RepID=UPI00359FA37C
MKTVDHIVAYPIIIKYVADNSGYPYLVTIPDLNNSMTEGKSVENAIAMAKDYIGTTSLVEELPKSNYTLPKANKGETVTLIRVNVSEYKRKNDIIS